jgi:hypothetical protein
MGENSRSSAAIGHLTLSTGISYMGYRARHLRQNLFNLSKPELRMSLAYHLQNNGQTNHVNQFVWRHITCVPSTPALSNASSGLLLQNSGTTHRITFAIGTSKFEALCDHGLNYTRLQDNTIMTEVPRQHLHGER